MTGAYREDLNWLVTDFTTRVADVAHAIVVSADGVPLQALVEMDYGLMFVKAVSDGSSLAVLAAPECDTRQVSYEMTRLVEAVGELLTPAIRAEV